MFHRGGSHRRGIRLGSRAAPLFPTHGLPFARPFFRVFVLRAVLFVPQNGEEVRRLRGGYQALFRKAFACRGAAPCGRGVRHGGGDARGAGCACSRALRVRARRRHPLFGEGDGRGRRAQHRARARAALFRAFGRASGGAFRPFSHFGKGDGARDALCGAQFLFARARALGRWNDDEAPAVFLPPCLFVRARGVSLHPCRPCGSGGGGDGGASLRRGDGGKGVPRRRSARRRNFARLRPVSRLFPPRRAFGKTKNCRKGKYSPCGVCALPRGAFGHRFLPLPRHRGGGACRFNFPRSSRVFFREAPRQSTFPPRAGREGMSPSSRGRA